MFFIFPGNMFNLKNIPQFLNLLITHYIFIFRSFCFFRSTFLLLIFNELEMEKDFGTNKPVRVALHPSSGNQLAIGFIDGSIRFCSFDLPESKIEVKIACIFFLLNLQLYAVKDILR